MSEQICNKTSTISTTFFSVVQKHVSHFKLNKVRPLYLKVAKLLKFNGVCLKKFGEVFFD